MFNDASFQVYVVQWRLFQVWCGLIEEFPMLTKLAFEVIIPFATTYLCEAGFSSLLIIKTQLRSRLVPKDDMQVALSTTAPRISKIVRGKQAQKSH